MRKKSTDKKKNKSILVMILDSYQEYCSLGYPRDPSVYVITVHSSNYEKLAERFKNEAITKSETLPNWGFQMLTNDNRQPDEVIFGPEQICIKWDGK